MIAGVHLRGPRRADTRALADLMSRPGVVQGLSVMPFVSEFEIERMLEAIEARHWIVAEFDGRAAGFVYLEAGRGRWRSIAMLAMGVADEASGKGVGRGLLEAALTTGFDYLGLNKIELVVYVDNTPAIRLYESVGFVHEGTKRGNAMRAGLHVAAHVMSILREDWWAPRIEPAARRLLQTGTECEAVRD